MRITRIYSAQSLHTGQQLSLDTQASAHLLKVLRLTIGAEIKIFNGQGDEFFAHINAIEKQHAIISVGDRITNLMESPLSIHLGQSVSRSEKMDYSIQKAIELGVHKITPLFTEHCTVALSGVRLEKRMMHWRAIIVSACEQCGRSYVPRLEEPISLSTWLSSCRESLRFILAPSGQTCLKDFTTRPESVALLVGPEGGFSEKEISLAQEFHFYSLQLGPRILRTETAAPAAIAALQCMWGDL